MLTLLPHQAQLRPLGLLLLLILASCAVPSNGKITAETSSTTSAAYKQTTHPERLVWQVNPVDSALIPVGDPLLGIEGERADLSLNVYEPLLGWTSEDRTGQPEPVLAQSWHADPQGSEYRFKLREGVKFHSGHLLTCADAEYTLRRLIIMNPDNGMAFLLAQPLLGTTTDAQRDKSVTWQRISQAVRCEGEGAEAELVVRPAQPDPDLPALLTQAQTGILDSQHAAELGEWDGSEETWRDFVNTDPMTGELWKNPSGTGAFRLTSHEDSILLFEAWSGYWGGVPAFKQVTVQSVPLEEVRYLALGRGDADIIQTRSWASDREGQLTSLPPGVSQVVTGGPASRVFALQLRPKVQAEWIGSGRWDGQGIPTDFFADEDMRLCFVKALDYSRLETEVLGEPAQGRTSPLPPHFPFAPDRAAPQQDLAQAEEHCRAAHGGQAWQHGFRVLAAQNGTYGRIALELLAQNLSEINPAFVLESVPDDGGGNAALAFVGFAADAPEPDHLLATFYSSQSLLGRAAGFDDQTALDNLLKKATQEFNPARRADLIAQAVTQAEAQVRYLWLPVPDTAVVLRADIEAVRGSKLTPDSARLWKNLRRKQP